MFQKASCLCHLELCFYNTPWTFTVMAKLNGPWFSTPPQHQELSEGHEAQHPAALRYPHASPRKKLCQSGLPGGLERDWNHDSQQRGHPKPWPQLHQSHALPAVWGCLHSSGTYREGFVSSALAKSDYPRSATSHAHYMLSQRSETSRITFRAAKRQLCEPGFTISFGKR